MCHLERFTLRNAQRAIRYQNTGLQGNTARWLHTVNTIMGISTRANELDFYVCDNILEGRLLWPHTYRDDNGIHAADDGIQVAGFGNVICHNRISGFGDAMKNSQDGARANDFYGNEILWTYDNGVELDGGEGNMRLLRNRFTNNYSPISVQPIYGGPAYILRNIVVNVTDEQMKFHGLQGTRWQTPVPVGVLAYHNTFVKAGEALLMNTPDVSHYFEIANNLFIGKPGAPMTVNWGGPIDHGTFDYNGWFPDGQFTFNVYVPVNNSQYMNWPNFAAVQAAGMFESHGALLPASPFTAAIPLGSDYTTFVQPQMPRIASGSLAVDRAKLLPNINDGFTGAAPDLGALEMGCPEPVYGPRAPGMDETNEPLGCAPNLLLPRFRSSPLFRSFRSSRLFPVVPPPVPTPTAVPARRRSVSASPRPQCA